MVLAGIALLSAVAVEFAYNSNVNYNLSFNDLDRVQAYYLANSALSFGKLMLKFDKEAQKVAQQATKQSGKNIMVPPLFEMIPLDTALIRAVAGMSENSETENDEAAPPVEAENSNGEEVQEPSALEQGIGFIDTQGAKDFFSFNGDFATQIVEEETKLNLNAFYQMDPKQKNYDRLKSVLYHLLATDEFEGLFSDRYRGAQELTQNIVDFIDKDEAQNDPGGQERGREGLQGGKNNEMKNAKLLSVEDLIQVPGMNDDILKVLRQYVTVYGKNEKIFLCRAEDPLVKAVILAYTENNPRMEPLKDDNKEMLDRAVEAVMIHCPDPASMARELDVVLGVAPNEDAGGVDLQEQQPETTYSSTGTTTQKKDKTNAQNSASNTFIELVKSDNSVYTLVGVGTVGDSEVKIKTVLDTSQGSPGQWEQLYWRVE